MTHYNQQAQILELLADQLKATPELGDRNIAGMLGVSENTVRVIRQDLIATAQIAQFEKTMGKDGKARKTLNEVAAQSASFTTHCRRLFAVSAHSESNKSRFMNLPAG